MLKSKAMALQANSAAKTAATVESLERKVDQILSILAAWKSDPYPADAMATAGLVYEGPEPTTTIATKVESVPFNGDLTGKLSGSSSSPGGPKPDLKKGK